MLALASVWIGLAVLALSAAMVVYRPAFTDLSVTLVLYFGSPGALCFSGLVLWAYRKDDGNDPGIVAQRKQAWVAIALALVAAAMVYLLVIFSHKLESFDRKASIVYHCPPRRAIITNDASKLYADYSKRPTENSGLRDDFRALACAAQA